VSQLWQSLLGGLEQILRFFHGVTEPLPLLGAASWGWAIILLTVTVRVVLLPLAVKQTNSMRAMQCLQPEIKRLQNKHKVDRALMRTNPEKYREARQKQQEAVMALYREHNVNPAAGCLPLLLQAPIFFALFSVLRSPSLVPELATNGFYLVGNLAAVPAQAGLGAWLLIILMGLTTFWSQRQMMVGNPSAAEQPQQKVLLYVMPVMLTFFAVNLPIGVLLYWVTTNVWTILQQWFMFRNIEPPGTLKSKPSKA
jgi:YidC/Oxa1 family membrane protein insertase